MKKILISRLIELISARGKYEHNFTFSFDRGFPRAAKLIPRKVVPNYFFSFDDKAITITAHLRTESIENFVQINQTNVFYHN